jgi:hypothetical protein
MIVAYKLTLRKKMNTESERSRRDASRVTKGNLNKLAEELWEVDWLLQSLYGFFFLRKVSYKATESGYPR